MDPKCYSAAYWWNVRFGLYDHLCNPFYLVLMAVTVISNTLCKSQQWFWNCDGLHNEHLEFVINSGVLQHGAIVRRRRCGALGPPATPHSASAASQHLPPPSPFWNPAPPATHPAPPRSIASATTLYSVTRLLPRRTPHLPGEIQLLSRTSMIPSCLSCNPSQICCATAISFCFLDLTLSDPPALYKQI
jgi:hypothetical protein